MTTTNPCPDACLLLSRTPSRDGLDPAIPVEHFGCTWRVARPHARRIIRVALESFPLSSLQRIASSNLNQVRRAPSGAVRRSMANDHSLVDELEQEVGICFWRSIALGRVRAALPVVAKWLSTSVPRIVRQCARQAALLRLLSSPTDDFAESEEGVSLPVDCGFTFDERNDECPEAFALLLEYHPELTSELPATQRAAFDLWIRGNEPREIAGMLGIKSGAVRVRLLRARQRIVEMVASNPPVRTAA